jgi:hypothetical protein
MVSALPDPPWPCEIGNSGTALQLFDGPLRGFANHVVFFYFNADWNDDLPLLEELNIVFVRCPSAVVMIDDFRVPGDPDYGYDDYGFGKALTGDYISAVVAKRGLVAHYPSAPGSAESGSRRGCVVLSNAMVHRTRLSSMPLLRTSDELGCPGQHSITEEICVGTTG